MSSFDNAYTLTMRLEGGASDDSRDKGGSTGTGGLTQHRYDSWREERGLEKRAVAAASPGERKEIALEEWLAARCDELTAPASIIMFDFAWNAGPTHAVMLLQAVVGVKTDGHFGPVTLREASRRFPLVLAHDLVTARRGYHLKAVIDDREQAAFIDGWLARCDDLEAFIAETSIVG